MRRRTGAHHSLCVKGFVRVVWQPTAETALLGSLCVCVCAPVGPCCHAVVQPQLPAAGMLPLLTVAMTEP